MKRFLFAASLSLFVGSPALAHIQLESPTARISDQKTGPCGAAGSTRGQNVTTFEAGETITITWRETINHPGHYRISFDADGQDDFGDPAAFDDFDSNPAVMLDNIGDANGGTYSEQLTLPTEPCDSCTIQVVQVMTDKAPYGDGNDLYYQCADIRIVAAPGGEPDAGTGEPDAGTSSPDAGGTPPVNSNNTTGTDPGNPNIDDGYIDTGDEPEAAACAAAGAATAWPMALLLVLGWGVSRRRRRSRRA